MSSCKVILRTRLCYKLIQQRSFHTNHKLLINHVRYSSTEILSNQNSAFTTSPSLGDVKQQQQSLLTSTQRQLVTRIKHLLTQLQIQLDLSKKDKLLLLEAVDRIEQIFLFVVVGEFNSGKSQFINALLNEKELCPTGVLPTTDHIHIIKYGDKREQRVEDNGIKEFYIKNELLKNTSLVDTPGTNAILQIHQQITEHFIPRSDLILFVTSVDRPFSESERIFLEKINEWKKKVIIVLNKIDQVRSQDDKMKILSYVKENAKIVLQDQTNDLKIFPISALNNVGIKELEQYIRFELNSENKIEIKLQNPLGICDHLLKQYQSLLSNRQTILNDDLKLLDLLEQDLINYRSEMLNDFQFQLNKIDNLFLQMLDNTDKFLSENVQLTKLIEMLYKGTGEMKLLFDEQVNKNMQQNINEYISTLCDWLVEKSNRTTQQISRHLSTTRVSGTSGGGLEFSLSRQTILNQLQSHCQIVLTDKERGTITQAEQLSQNIKSTMIQTAAVEIGAVGLGALATLATFDWTGIAGAGLLAVTGLYIIPMRRSAIKKEMRKRIGDTQTKINEVLHKHFTNELDSNIRKMKQDIQPYERFVRVEQEKLLEMNEKVELIKKEIKQLRIDIKQLHSK